jgi:heavy metal sensor kinase
VRISNIRWRLTLWNAFVLTLLFGIFCSVMLVLVHRHLQAQADVWMKEELSELNEDVNFTNDVENLQQRLEKKYAVHSHHHFRITDQSGRIIFLSQFLSDVIVPRPPEPEKLRGPVFQDLEIPNVGAFRLLSMAMRDDQSRPLLLQVAAPKTAVIREFEWYLGTVLAFVPLALAIALGTGYVLARQALSPIDQMVATAERISAEHLNERLTIANPRDELGRLAATLNAMFDRLHRSIDQMRRFTSDAAHELRSPIAALRTEAEVVLRADDKPMVSRRVVEQTVEEASRLSDLVNQLLTLSRHDAGQASRLEDSIRVDLVVLDVIDRLQSKAQERQVRLSAQSLPAWLALGDDILLSQLFYNLVDNALKYTPAGGSVRVWGHVYGDELVLGVQDTGIGIPMELQHRIFDRFFRVDPSQNGERGGAGLGLAICRAIVETHRGRIEVSSAPGEGSCFQVTIPGRPDEEPLESLDEAIPLDGVHG